MEIINKTTIPDTKIQTILQLVIPDKLVRHIKHIRFATSRVISLDATLFPDGRINIIVGDSSHFPTISSSKNWEKYGYIPFRLCNRTEAVVFLLAHEVRHLWQSVISTQDWFTENVRHYLKRGQSFTSSAPSEHDADKWAIKKVEEYRAMDNT
jgi:hypothetical protein